MLFRSVVKPYSFFTDYFQHRQAQLLAAIARRRRLFAHRRKGDIHYQRVQQYLLGGKLAREVKMFQNRKCKLNILWHPAPPFFPFWFPFFFFFLLLGILYYSS